jgi:hypothetical protein
MIEWIEVVHLFCIDVVRSAVENLHYNSYPFGV